jgi:cell division protein FtsW (lipid II flippase)
MAFMGHGLIASFFMMTTAVAATALWRTRIQLFRLPSSGLTAYLVGVLVLCKSFGALLYGIVLVPLVKWTGARFQMRVAVVLVTMALLYPALRSLDLFPTQSLLEAIAEVSEDRMKSLDFRFKNEDKLLRHAFERPAFGWGRYGRYRVYDENSGQDESVTDGLWVITIGSYGLFGFIAQFGLLSIGVWRASSVLKLSKSAGDALVFSTIALIVAINIVELIPNSGLLPWSWLLCGALLGRADSLQSERIRKRRPVKMPSDFVS